MTAEAALAKLYYLFSAGLSPEQVKARMPVSLCGELTPRGRAAPVPAGSSATPSKRAIGSW
jgi:hypothetical protein